MIILFNCDQIHQQFSMFGAQRTFTWGAAFEECKDLSKMLLSVPFVSLEIGSVRGVCQPVSPSALLKCFAHLANSKAHVSGDIVAENDWCGSDSYFAKKKKETASKGFRQRCVALFPQQRFDLTIRSLSNMMVRSKRCRGIKLHISEETSWNKCFFLLLLHFGRLWGFGGLETLHPLLIRLFGSVLLCFVFVCIILSRQKTMEDHHLDIAKIDGIYDQL